MIEKTFKVTDPSGIHAQSATVLIRKANTFNCDIKIEKDQKIANLKSIMGVMSLAIEYDSLFKLTVSGNDEEKALINLTDMLSEKGLAKAI